MTRLRACLVDVYDTILTVDYGAFGTELPELAGLPLGAWAEARGRIGPMLNIGHLTKPEGFGLVLRANGIEPGPDVIRALVDRSRDQLLESARLYEDSIPFLENLRSRGVKVAIVSNCSEDTRDLLVKHGIDALADVLVLSCEAGTAKPSAQIYRQALGQLGTDAAESSFVDDQPVFCAGAQALGITAVQIVREQRVDHAPESWTSVVRSLREAEDLLFG